MSNQELKDASFGTGAVRSADADHLDFMSMPLIGLIGVARTAYEGGTKYGRFNYMLGMPAHTCVNHAIRHLILWAMGDRSEPHLSHAAWNCMTAEQSATLNPELNAPHLPGPGFTLTDEVIEHLNAGKAERDRKRAAGEFARLADWAIDRLPEVRTILKQRRRVNELAEEQLRLAIDSPPCIGTPGGCFPAEDPTGGSVPFYDYAAPMDKPIVPLVTNYEHEAAREALKKPPTTVAPGHSLPLKEGESVLLSGPAAIHGGDPEVFLGKPKPKG
jgi:hypothetical protein